MSVGAAADVWRRHTVGVEGILAIWWSRGSVAAWFLTVGIFSDQSFSFNTDSFESFGVDIRTPDQASYQVRTSRLVRST